MWIKRLRPDQIITLNDYPIRNEQILKLYYHMYARERADLVPPCPVLHKSKGLFRTDKTQRAKTYNRVLRAFYRKHPAAEYFLLDGSHKTTAAALSHNSIRVMIFETDADIAAAKDLVEKGEVFSLATGDSFSREQQLLKNHFSRKMRFETVAEKTARLVKDRLVPTYMIQDA